MATMTRCSIGSWPVTGATGAIDPSTQASPTTARAAGPQAMSSGRATSGAASATRAAHR